MAKAKKETIDPALREAAQRNAKAIEECGTFLIVWNPAMIDEVIPILQMGLAVYLDKPILLLIQRGSPVPINVRRLALHVAEYDVNEPGSFEAAAAELKRVIEQ